MTDLEESPHIKIDHWKYIDRVYRSTVSREDATRTDITVWAKGRGGRPPHRITLEIHLGEADREDFYEEVRTVVDMLKASFESGKRARSKEFKDLLEDGA